MSSGFEKREWVRRETEFPGRRRLKQTTTGEEQVVDVTREEGLVMEEGDGWTPENMNDLEARILAALSDKANVADVEEALQTKANANTPLGYRTLWEGNAGQGQTINTPGMDEYRLVMCESGGRMFILSTGNGTLWDGGMMYQPGPAAHYSIGIRATLNGSGESAQLTISQCASMAHNQNGNHAAIAATTINRIFVPETP